MSSIRTRGKLKVGVLLGLLTACLPLGAGAQQNGDLLSPAQRTWLEETGPVTMVVDPDWMPFERLDAEGNFTGIAADLVALVGKRLGIDFQLIPTRDWNESLDISRSGGAMLIPFLNQTPARETWLTFTEPLLHDKNVLITRSTFPYISDLGGLSGMTLVLPEGTSVEERIRQDYPNLRIRLVPDEDKVFRMVSQGEADLTVRSLIIAAYTIRKDGHFNLKIAGELPSEYTNALRMGVLHAYAPLVEILNAGIATITPGEREEILNRHIYIRVEEAARYQIFFQVIGGLLFFCFLSLLWAWHMRRLNQRLEDSERRHSILLANLPGIAYRCKYDDKWTMEFVSEGCRELTGYDPEDLLGNKAVSFADLIDAEMHGTIDEIWRRAIATHSPAELEYRIHTRNGETKWVWEQGVIIYNDQGRIEALEGLILDITSRKKMERELIEARNAAENAEKIHRDFLAKMSHEIKNPLNGILNLITLLRDPLPDQDQQRYLRQIDLAGKNLQSLLQDLLDLSKIEAGMLVLRPAPFSLQELSGVLVERFRPVALAKQLELTAKLSAALPAQVVGDALRITQILENLLSNAIKFTAQGSVHLSCTRQKQHGLDGVRMEVIDTGIGIPAETQKLLFQRYVQSEPHLAQPYGGTGLGLLIIRELVEQMGGKLYLHSHPDQGSRFGVWLPLPEWNPVQPAASGEVSAPRLLPNLPPNFRVLVVDDQEINRTVALAILKKLGVFCTSATGGGEALALMLREPFDLVLLDLQMQDIDGQEVARRYYSERPGDPLLIFAMSGADESQIRAEINAAGITAFIPKPIDPLHLVATIHQVLEQDTARKPTRK